MAIFRRQRLTNPAFLFLILITSSCKSRSQSQEIWTRDMEVTIYHGGGMVPESFTVLINSSTASYIHWYQPKTDTLSFSLSQPQLDSLLREINTRDFRKIVSGETDGITYDKPTTSISFRWSDQVHKVSVGATEEIKKGSPADFNGLWSYIIRLVMKKTGQDTGQ